jgi:hypothetical protein
MGLIMYRAPDHTPRCSSCSGASLTPLTKFDTSDGFANLYFRDQSVMPSVFGGDGSRTLSIDRARVCLDCGQVMLAFSEKRLTELRNAMGTFGPVE